MDEFTPLRQNALSLLSKLKWLIKICRILLIVLNAIVLVFALYLMISRKDLSFSGLDLSLAALITVGVVTILLALFGIAIGSYPGKKKKKLHYRLTLTYAISTSLMFLICAILSAVFVRHLNAADIVFTVLVLLLALILLPVGFGYYFVLKKSKSLKKFNII